MKKFKLNRFHIIAICVTFVLLLFFVSTFFHTYSEYVTRDASKIEGDTVYVNDLANDQNTISNINNFVHPYNSFKTLKTEVDSAGKITIEIEKVYDGLNVLKDLSIALYDPDGSMISSFKSMLSSFEESFRETIVAINNALYAAMFSEINNIKIAKQEATSTMSN